MQQRTRYRKLTLGLLSLGLLVGAALMTGPTQAATSNGPYYAEPAWDQKLPVATRFIVLTDWSSQAVLDRETGLVWEQAPQTATAMWSSARLVCTGKTTGGRKGWRLPSVHELASLIDPNASTNPVLPSGHPFTNVLFTYWSATTDAGTPTLAWVVHFFDGSVGANVKASSDQRVWCVRGGMNADVY
jgi:Protein of unknown function (DUF1566)